MSRNLQKTSLNLPNQHKNWIAQKRPKNKFNFTQLGLPTFA